MLPRDIRNPGIELDSSAQTFPERFTHTETILFCYINRNGTQISIERGNKRTDVKSSRCGFCEMRWADLQKDVPQIKGVKSKIHK